LACANPPVRSIAATANDAITQKRLIVRSSQSEDV
jgi:hypothetical protein